jgi:hypothetical protein
MEIKKFFYSGKPREVLVSRETPTNLMGFELSALIGEDGLKEQLRSAAPRLSAQGKSIVFGEESEPYPYIQKALKSYKNFSKAKIQEIEETQGHEGTEGGKEKGEGHENGKPGASQESNPAFFQTGGEKGASEIKRIGEALPPA